MKLNVKTLRQHNGNITAEINAATYLVLVMTELKRKFL